MSDYIRVKFAPNADSIINECLDFNYEDAVSLAKGKYYYEHIDGNTEGVRKFDYYTSADQPGDHLDVRYINNIITIDVLFPHHFFHDQLLNLITAYQFGVLCEINSYLKRIIPTKVKKAKAIGTFERKVLNVDDEGAEELGGEGARVTSMEEEKGVFAPQYNDGQGDGHAATIRKLAIAESYGLFRLKHMNKLYIFKRGEERLRAVGVQDKRIVFDVIARYENL